MAITLKLDPTSSLTVKMPRRSADVIAIARAYVAREETLPVAERNPAPPLADVVALLAAASDAAATASDSKHSHAAAAGRYGQLMDEIIDRLSWALRGRARDFVDNLPQIEAWGVDTVMGVHGHLLAFPKRHAQWLKLLDDYIAKEESLPPAARCQNPSLAHMQALRSERNACDRARAGDEVARRSAVADRQEATAVLRSKLLVALHVLVDGRFDGKLSVSLAAWGFPVKEKRPRRRITAVADDGNGLTPRTNGGKA